MLATCVHHPESLAGWRCGACAAALCPACTAWKQEAGGAVELCTRCGGRAQVIQATRGELKAAEATRAGLGGLLGKARAVRPSAQDAELVPVLGDATPQIQLGGGGGDGDAPAAFDHAGNPITVRAAEAPRSYAPIEIDFDEDEALPEGVVTFQPLAAELSGPLELDLEAPPGLDASEDPSDGLARLLAQGHLAAALEVLAEHGPKLLPTALPPERWLWLAKQAIEAKQGKPASFALRRCLDAAPQGPHAPEAWLLAARTYDQLLGDRATSDRLLGELAKRFPQTREGQFAAARLRGR